MALHRLFIAIFLGAALLGACKESDEPKDESSSTIADTEATTTGDTEAATEPTTGSTGGATTTDPSGESTAVDPSAISLDDGGHCENFLPPIDQDTVPPGKVGEPYSVTFTIGDDMSLSWELTDEPPPGLSFDADTATLAGTPTLAGEFLLDIMAFVEGDGGECPTAPANARYTLTVAP